VLLILYSFPARRSSDLEAATAVSELTRDGDRAPSMATFSAARKREKELHASISEELIKTFVTSLDREDIEAMNAALYRIPKTIRSEEHTSELQSRFDLV